MANMPGRAGAKRRGQVTVIVGAMMALLAGPCLARAASPEDLSRIGDIGAVGVPLAAAAVSLPPGL